MLNIAFIWDSFQIHTVFLKNHRSDYKTICLSELKNSFGTSYQLTIRNKQNDCDSYICPQVVSLGSALE